MEDAIAATVFGIVFVVGAPVIYGLQQSMVPKFRGSRWHPFARFMRNLFVVAGLILASVGIANIVLAAK